MKPCTLFRTLLVAAASFYYTCATAADGPDVSLQHHGRNDHYYINPPPPPLPEPADVVIFNTKVITVDSNSTVEEALAVRGGKIVAVGKDEQLKLYKGPKTRMIDG